jgi:hypothetical protein
VLLFHVVRILDFWRFALGVIAIPAPAEIPGTSCPPRGPAGVTADEAISDSN